MERDAAAYLQLIEAKDESIVRLTNQLHEVELQAKIDQVHHHFSHFSLHFRPGWNYIFFIVNWPNFGVILYFVPV